MTIGSICKRNVVVAPKGGSIVDAARRMRMSHVGTVIAVDERGGKQVPVGILTDRDIVLSIVATDAEHLPFLTVSDAMSDDILTAVEETSVSTAASPVDTASMVAIAWMAGCVLTGVFLFGWVLAHMLGNMKLYFGPEHMNEYAHWLRTMGAPAVPEVSDVAFEAGEVAPGLSTDRLTHLVQITGITGCEVVQANDFLVEI